MKRLSRALLCVVATFSSAGAAPVWSASPETPSQCRLSSAGLFLMRCADGEFDPHSVWAAPVLQRSPGSLRPVPQGKDIRINDIGKDLAQMRIAPFKPATTQSDTSVAVSGSNVVVGYNDSAALNSMSRSLNGYSVSSDGGRTWLDGSGTPSAPGTVNAGDPSVVVNRQGIFYYASMVLDYNGTDGGRGVIGVAKSTDGGRTFGTPVVVNPFVPPLRSIASDVDGITTALSDKELMAVDTSGGPRDGALYVVWNQYTATTYTTPTDPTITVRTTSRIMMACSVDGGGTWTTPVPVCDLRIHTAAAGHAVGYYVSGAVPVVGPGGEVYCAWEESGANMPSSVERFARSDDGGKTFALANQSAVSLNNIGNATDDVLSGGVRANEFPSLAVDMRYGVLYMAFASAPTMFPGNPDSPRSSDRSDIYLVRSTNKGHTWSAPVRMNNDSTLNDQFFPVVRVSASGSVGVIWYDRRNDPYNQRFDVYMALSRDGGRTFGANQRITSVASPLPQMNPNFDANIAVNYMGDYIGLACDGDRFYMAWGDNRDVLNSTSYGPRPDPNVYFSMTSPGERSPSAAAR